MLHVHLALAGTGFNCCIVATSAGQGLGLRFNDTETLNGNKYRNLR